VAGDEPLSTTQPVDALLAADSARPEDLGRALTRTRIGGLDVLRAIAVMSVLTSHAVVSGRTPPILVDGVELFFVLSGFLITRLLLQEFDQSGRIRLTSFYRRRAARLLPAFYAYLLLGLVYLAWRQKPIPWGAVVSSLLYVLNYDQALSGAPTHFLSHCWSLAVEEQFYFLWPLLLLLALRRGVRLEWALAGVIVAIWLLRPTLYMLPGVGDEYVYRALETRADHLAAGCLLAVALRHQRVLRFFEACARRKWIALAITALIVTSTLQHASLTYKYLVGFAVEPLLMAFLLPLVVLLAEEHRLASRLINARIVVRIGEASYGMYLIHPLVMPPVANAIARGTGSDVAGVFGAIVAVTCIAFASLHCFENPVRKRLRGD
jgi:peptidoglycan/LPS O-acetylase OafA/YrhL